MRRCHAQRTFQLADANGDGALDEKEHYDFQHPEESGRHALHMHLLEEDVRDRAADTGKDKCAHLPCCALSAPCLQAMILGKADKQERSTRGARSPSCYLR